jgi:hypothetical protein
LQLLKTISKKNYAAPQYWPVMYQNIIMTFSFMIVITYVYLSTVSYVVVQREWKILDCCLNFVLHSGEQILKQLDSHSVMTKQTTAKRDFSLIDLIMLQSNYCFNFVVIGLTWQCNGIRWKDTCFLENWCCSQLRMKIFFQCHFAWFCMIIKRKTVKNEIFSEMFFSITVLQ